MQLLDHVSKSLPDMLWLTDMEQEGGAVTIQGRSTTLIALSDFVGNLGNGGFLKKPIEIVNSQVDSDRSGAAQAVELINFTVKAELASAGRAAGAGPAGQATPPPGREWPRDAFPERRVSGMRIEYGDQPKPQQVALVHARSACSSRCRQRPPASFWNWYARDGRWRASTRARRSWRRSTRTSNAVWPRRSGCRSSVAKWSSSKRSSNACARSCRRSRTSRDLLRRVQAMATQSRLTIRGFTPQARAAQMHAEWPIGLQLEGTYHDLGTFLERVSKFPRIINVGDIHIKRARTRSRAPRPSLRTAPRRRSS